jgi:cell division protein FtsZ
MFEIHDAAKLITESVDPNAKIIFGTVRDERLKKGEIKITVIASGFPENHMMKSSLFTEKEKEDAEGASRGKIFNTVFKKEERREPVPTSTEEPEEKKQNVIIDDDDEWGAVPAFLRRSKLK